MPTAKVDVDPTFELRLRELRDHAATQAARFDGGGGEWYRPGDEDRTPFDPYDPVAIGPLFSREAVNTAGVAAMSVPNEGTAGDLVLAHTQVAVLSALERAVRARYTMSRVRAGAHAVARAQGHADPTGPVTGVVEYARYVAAQSRQPS